MLRLSSSVLRLLDHESSIRKHVISALASIRSCFLQNFGLTLLENDNLRQEYSVLSKDGITCPHHLFQKEHLAISWWSHAIRC